MKTITYQQVQTLVEAKIGMPVNVDMFWGSHEVMVYPPKMEVVYFRLFRNLARASTKKKPHKRDNGHTLTMNDVHKIIWHFCKTKVLPLGSYKVVP